MGIQSYEKTVEIERAEGFDRAAAETAIGLAFERHGIDGSLDFFPSRNPGVLAFEQLDSFDVDDAAIQAAMNEVAAEIGIHVACVANCDWSFDDDCDQEATLVAFDIPSLPADYRDDYRNRIEPTAEFEPAAPAAA